MKTESKTKYYKYCIDYIHSNPAGANFYYQLVRTADDAILYSNSCLDYVFAYCFKTGIHKDSVMVL
jgi:hypothetical protein